MPLCTDISQLGLVVKACPRCIELTTELVAARHELAETKRRHTETLAQIEAMLDEQLSKQGKEQN